MNNQFDNLKAFFERIKTLSFWQRVFYWSTLKALSYDAYDEFSGLTENINILNQDLSGKETRIKELEKNIEITSARLTDMGSSTQKFENKIIALENELSHLNKEKTELSTKIARFEQVDQTRAEEFMKNMSSVNVIRKGLEDERNKISDDRVREKEEQFTKMKQTWSDHENLVKSSIRNICRSHLIEYVEKVPFKGTPDNTIKIAGEYIIFDAKSPAGEDLENFPKYLKIQTDSVKKYIKQENVKSDIFLVVPSNTTDAISQFSYNMGDYNVYIVTIDSLEPVILTLKKIEDYEFAEQLTPDERENICRIIGKFSHTIKRKIQIDYFFSYQFLEILSKCDIDLPADLYKSVQEFEKAEKLNPPQEKRSKQILTEELFAISEKLALEARDKIFNKEDKSEV
jgi:hypothetical protein